MVCAPVLSVAVVVTLTRLVGGDQRTPLVEFAVLVPFVAVLLVPTAALALVARAWSLALAALLLLVVQLVWLAPSFGVGTTRPTRLDVVQRLHVMTLNTLTGFADADAIVREVRERRVDLLATEEITPALEGRLRAAGLDGELPHVAGVSVDGARGTMIWSRWPLEDLPSTIATGQTSDLPTVFEIPRRVLRLPSGVTVTVTAVHTLSPVPGRVQPWRGDLAALRAAVRATAGPQIVLGDFNATRDHGGFRGLLSGPAALTDAADAVGLLGGAWPGFTWPADKVVPPFMRLDHILVTGHTIGVDGLDVVSIPGTDHRGLVSTLAVVRP